MNGRKAAVLAIGELTKNPNPADALPFPPLPTICPVYESRVARYSPVSERTPPLANSKGKFVGFGLKKFISHGGTRKFIPGFKDINVCRSDSCFADESVCAV